MAAVDPSSDALADPSSGALPASLPISTATAPSAETSLASSPASDDELLDPEPPAPAFEDVPKPGLPVLEPELDPPDDELPYMAGLGGVPVSLPHPPIAVNAKAIPSAATWKKPRRFMECSPSLTWKSR
jgi:hypothetical protein